MSSKNRHGFTLIELMVVISIISLLSSIILASVSMARDKAKIAVAQGELHQYQTAIELYNADHASYPALDSSWHCIGSGYPAGKCGFVGHSGEAVESSTFTNDIKPYISSPALDLNVKIQGFNFLGAVYQCPSDTNGVCNEGAIFWYLPGNQNCGLSGSQSTYYNYSPPYDFTSCNFTFGSGNPSNLIAPPGS